MCSYVKHMMMNSRHSDPAVNCEGDIYWL